MPSVGRGIVTHGVWDEWLFPAEFDFGPRRYSLLGWNSWDDRLWRYLVRKSTLESITRQWGHRYCPTHY